MHRRTTSRSLTPETSSWLTLLQTIMSRVSQPLLCAAFSAQQQKLVVWKTCLKMLSFLWRANTITHFFVRLGLVFRSEFWGYLVWGKIIFQTWWLYCSFHLVIFPHNFFSSDYPIKATRGHDKLLTHANASAKSKPHLKIFKYFNTPLGKNQEFFCLIPLGLDYILNLQRCYRHVNCSLVPTTLKEKQVFLKI